MSDKPEHPAWRKFWDARNKMEKLLEAAGEQKIIMEYAAEELEKAGEMLLDSR